MDYVDDNSRHGSSNGVNGILKKVNFSRVSSQEKLEITRRFKNNPHFDEVDLYYLGLLDEEESSEEKKIPKGSSETEPSKKIPKGKRSKREKRGVAAVFDHSPSEAEAADALLFLNPVVLNQNHPLPLEEELTNNNNKKKPKIITSEKPIDTGCCCPIDDISGPKKKKKKRPRTVDQQREAEEDRAKKIRLFAPPPPEVPPKLKTRIEKLGGSQVMLVIEKELLTTDVTPGNGRFSLPLTKINPDFLIPEEREFLSGKTTTGLPNPQIQSQLIQPCGEECAINLREWHMKSPIYNLVTTWNDVVKTNSLHKGMTVQLWSFRVDSQLRLALVEAGKDIQ